MKSLMAETKVFENILTALNSSTSELQPVMILYGVGKFDNLLDNLPTNISGGLGNEMNGAKQLGVALELVERLGVQRAFYYDPVQTQLEVEALTSPELLENKTSVTVLNENKHGLQDFTGLANSNSYILFMPHCPGSLYSNVLFSNWNNSTLEKTQIIGNSFREYNDSLDSTVRGQGDDNCVLKIVNGGAVRERSIQVGGDDRVFNNTVVIGFVFIDDDGRELELVDDLERIESNEAKPIVRPKEAIARGGGGEDEML